jgi:hypothetical protein
VRARALSDASTRTSSVRRPFSCFFIL